MSDTESEGEDSPPSCQMDKCDRVVVFEIAYRRPSYWVARKLCKPCLLALEEGFGASVESDDDKRIEVVNDDLRYH